MEKIIKEEEVIFACATRAEALALAMDFEGDIAHVKRVVIVGPNGPAMNPVAYIAVPNG